jgi:hypothetical protein
MFTRISVAFVITMVAAVVFLNLTINSTSAGNWPQWRGPEGQGISAETGLPVEWSPTKNIKWKTAIAGRGHSSPIVWSNRIFLTTALDGDVIPGAKAGVTHRMLDGTDFVHPDALGADRKHTFKIICLDRETGKILWQRVAYEGAVADSRHQKASFASSTPATDGKLFSLSLARKDSTLTTITADSFGNRISGRLVRQVSDTVCHLSSTKTL